MKPTHVFLFALCLVSGCRESTPATKPEVDEVLQLINDRLSVMPDVAKAKVDLGLPVDDNKREEALLQAAEVDANKNGLTAAFIRLFFTAQFEAGKMVQRRAMEKWPRTELNEEGMKQAGQRMEEARTKINTINVKLITALAKLRSVPADERQRLLAERAAVLLANQDDDVRTTALQPLLEWK